METTTTLIESLQDAARYLAGRDSDHATYENGVGYSKADGSFGHGLAILPASEWTPEVVHDAYWMLRGYRTQLVDVLDFDTIPEPDQPDHEYTTSRDWFGRATQVKAGRHKVAEATREQRRAERVDQSKNIEIRGDTIIVEFAYDARLVSLCRDLPGRRWDASRKVNVFPLTSARAIAEFGETEGFAMPSELEILAEGAPEVEKMPNVVINSKTVEVSFSYDPNLVASLKDAIDSQYRRWNGERKIWEVDVTQLVQITDWANAHNLIVDQDNISSRYDEMKERVTQIEVAKQEKIEASKALDADITIPELVGELLPFQRAGVAYAVATRRCIIGDDMGLGKTVQALASIVVTGQVPAIVVVPKTVKINWQRSVAQFFPHLTTEIVNGTKSQPLAGADVTIVNYDIAGDRVADLLAIGAKALIVDESHYLKNGKQKFECPTCTMRVRANARRCDSCGAEFAKAATHWTVKRTDAVMKLADSIGDDGMILLLSGTASLQRPNELVAQLAAIRQLHEFGGTWKFLKRYCAAYDSGWGYNTSGASHLGELNDKLRATCFLRRQKNDVFTELPARRHADLAIELSRTEMKRYAEIEADVIGELVRRAKELGEDWRKHLRAEAAIHLVKIGVLRRAAAEAKLAQAIEWIQDFLDGDDERKLIVFGEHIDIVERLAEHFGNLAVKIRGGVSEADRTKAVDRFQTDPSCRLFLGNMKAAGEGITLTAASDVLFVEMGWTPAIHDQCIDRCFGRINDLHGATGWYALALGTIDERIYKLINAKRKVVDMILDGKSDTAKSSSVAGDLLVELVEENNKEG